MSVDEDGVDWRDEQEHEIEVEEPLSFSAQVAIDEEVGVEGDQSGGRQLGGQEGRGRVEGRE